MLLSSRTTTQAFRNLLVRSKPALSQLPTRRCLSAESDNTDDLKGELIALSKAPLSSLLPKEHPIWQEYYLPPPPADFLELSPGRRVVTFGDVHGDLEALQEFLQVAGVLDPNSSTAQNPVWCGGDTICVQVGDVLDRGNDELACWRLLTSLARQAQAQGGALYLLYGNHETLNTAGLFQYANPGGNQEFEETFGQGLLNDSTPLSNIASIRENEVLRDASSRWRIQFAGNEPSRWATIEPGGVLAKPLLQNMRVAMVVGRTCFVHAGLTANLLREYKGLENMNRAARDWIVQSHHGDNNNLGLFQDVNDVIKQAQQRASAATKTMPSCLGGGSGSELSPVWMRTYSSPPDMPPAATKAQQMIDECLRELGPDVQRMVMGHTPQRQINAALQNKAWRVDVGASKGVMGGKPQVLEIIHGEEEDEINILTESTSVSVENSVGDLVGVR